jgi:hypothetical protein
VHLHFDDQTLLGGFLLALSATVADLSVVRLTALNVSRLAGLTVIVAS